MKTIRKSPVRKLPMESRFNAVFEKRGKWWIGYVEEVPGANSQGRTLKEVRENLKEAVKLVIETNRVLSVAETSGQNIIKEQIRVSV